MLHVSIGDYRTSVLKEVRSRFDRDSLEIYAADRSPDGTITVMSPADVSYTHVKTAFLPLGIVIQFMPLGRLLNADGLVLDLNPRLPHVWLILGLRKLLGRRTVVWGHAWPRNGRSSRRTGLRLRMAGLADVVLTYTETQARDLRPLLSDQKIIAAPNALYPADQFCFDDGAVRNSFIYVGRLVEAKHPDLLLEAFRRVSGELPHLKLLFVGEGPLKTQLERAAASYQSLTGRVHFIGHVSDYQQLKDLYSSAIASVSPGYVGLSLIQSLSFGVPMILPGEGEPHAPEIEAAAPGVNCILFDAKDPSSLASQLEGAARERDQWRARGPMISEAARGKYSVESMAGGIVSALQLPAAQ